MAFQEGSNGALLNSFKKNMTTIVQKETIKTQLGISEATHDATIDRLIKVVDGFLGKKMNRVLVETEKTFVVDGEGDDCIFLGQYPLTLGTYGTDHYVKISTVLEDQANTFFDTDIGKIELLSGVFPTGKRNIEIKCKLGWAADAIPDEITHLATELVTALFTQYKVDRFNAGSDEDAPNAGGGKTKVVKSEREGDVQISYDYVNISGAPSMSKVTNSAIDSMLSGMGQEILSLYTIEPFGAI